MVECARNARVGGARARMRIDARVRGCGRCPDGRQRRRRSRGQAAARSGASSPNKPGFQTPAVLTGDWGGARTTLYDAGVSILPSYAIELFGTPALDTDRTAFDGLVALEVELDLLDADRLAARAVLHRGLRDPR